MLGCTLKMPASSEVRRHCKYYFLQDVLVDLIAVIVINECPFEPRIHNIITFRLHNYSTKCFIDANYMISQAMGF